MHDARAIYIGDLHINMPIYGEKMQSLVLGALHCVKYSTI
jgi:hypothetical protein